MYALTHSIPAVAYTASMGMIPSLNWRDMCSCATQTLLAEVTNPLALTVITGITVVEPNDPTLELTVANVNAADTAADDTAAAK